MANTVADNMVAALKGSGVSRVYGLPGDSLNGFVDALRRDGSIDWVHVRHEEAAAFAAAADAALTGELAVCVGSCGPGNTHLINGLYDAQRTRVPVLVIAAQIPGAEIGGEYFQETHPQTIFAECSVYTELISTPETAPHIFEIAMRAAVERRGVAVVVVPGEVFLSRAERVTLPAPIRAASPLVRPSEVELVEAAQKLNATEKVTILAGAGCQGARDEVLALAARLKAPIVHTFRGKEIFEYDNAYDVGMTGLLGFTSGYKAIADADVVLMLGTDFPYRQFLPSPKTYIQVDLRGEHLGRRAKLSLGLVGTVRDTAAALLPLIVDDRSDSHLDSARTHYARARSGLDSFAVNDRNRSPIHPEYVARVIDETAASDAVFTVDVGSPVVWAARYLTMNGERRIMGSFNHGTMANAVPHAIGAQVAYPGRQIVTLSGDGGLAMLLGELLTLVQMDLPVKVVVFNNSALDFVEVEMKAAGIVNWGTELKNPDFSAVAEAMGIFGRRVTHPDDLRRAMEDAFAHDGPALVEVVTARQELSIPPTITVEQAKGFSLYAIRTILSGAGDELLDLIDTNVARRILR
ncbi:ubiquinone-dependent pyruvate dehydrogenase [Protaetiibacter intestinalis]|uniref:Pyruvate dehydrogenase [ubiquinone] n=1 Tax=Protaetiibacter intestinalis TaxID=2419774 RepID=A0A387B627_9MICO|nr:ubiquinone-dependent pyruvate dehydrogenase [Protaetiibacter intestinalis]AYF97218.1 ubiquinone-dependent pyruvate dehydrogenase [Protaetiibacter intestinalis]